MITKIGLISGSIWEYLDKNGPTELQSLLSNIQEPHELTLMSVGWLTREGHVVLEQNQQNYILSLRDLEYSDTQQ